MTLVEVLVAVGILSLAAVAVLIALAAVSHALAVAENRAGAYSFSLSKMAELQMAAGVAASQGQPLQWKAHGAFRVGAQPFDWSVATEPAPIDPALELLTLTLAWAQGDQGHESRFKTLIRIPEEGQKKQGGSQ